MLNEQETSKVWELIKDIPIAMLADWNGQFLQSRPMQRVQDHFDGNLYFFTHRSSAKVDEILRNREVNVSFSDPSHKTFVSLSGHAELVTDRSTVDRYWDKTVSAWFPEGKDSPEVALLKIQTHLAQYWDAPANKLVQIYKLTRANLTDEKPDMGEGHKLG